MYIIYPNSFKKKSPHWFSKGKKAFLSPDNKSIPKKGGKKQILRHRGERRSN